MDRLVAVELSWVWLGGLRLIARIVLGERELFPSTESHCLQCLLRVNPVVERHYGVVKFLVGLVPLAGNEHDVPRFGLADDLLDGPAAVEFDGAGFAAHGAETFLDLRGDL